MIVPRPPCKVHRIPNPRNIVETPFTQRVLIIKVQAGQSCRMCVPVTDGVKAMSHARSDTSQFTQRLQCKQVLVCLFTITKELHRPADASAKQFLVVCKW
jgi:hypothetical protein